MGERRYKDRSEFTADEEFEFQRNRAVPERDEYRQLRAEALENAGLEPDTAITSEVTEDLTVEDHYNRIRSH